VLFTWLRGEPADDVKPAQARKADLRLTFLRERLRRLSERSVALWLRRTFLVTKRPLFDSMRTKWGETR
jgi:hypothetical protein